MAEGLGPTEDELTGAGNIAGPEAPGAVEQPVAADLPEQAEPAEPIPAPEEQSSPSPEPTAAPKERKWHRYTEQFKRGVKRLSGTEEESAEDKARREEEQAQPRAERVARKLDAAQARRAGNNAEILKSGARNPSELLDLIANNDFKRLHEIENETKYGKGFVGKAKAFFAGEYDIKVDDDGSMSRNVLAEAGRKALGLVADRRTAIKALTYLGMGALTGGLGWAAGGVLFGGIAGKGVAELYDLVGGKTSGARGKLMEAERERWEELQALTLRIEQAEDPVEKNSLTRQVVDLMYRQGDHVLLRNIAEKTQDLEDAQAKLSKLRGRLMTVGELVGGGIGIEHLLSGAGVEHLDLDSYGAAITGHFNNIHQAGEGIFHGVQLAQAQGVGTGSAWNFFYNSAHEAAVANLAGAHFANGVAGQFGAHALQGASNGLIAGAAIAERAAPMFLASMLALGSEKLSASRQDGPKEFWGRVHGERVYYTHNTDGSYEIWRRAEPTEEEKKKNPRAQGKWTNTPIGSAYVPDNFRRFHEGRSFAEDARNAERLHDQIERPSQMLRRVADENHVYVPDAPNGFNYNWHETPQVVRTDALDLSKLEKWHPLQQPDSVDPATGQTIKAPLIIDPATGRLIRVYIAGVDHAANRIAIIDFMRDPASGAEYYPIEVMRLDEFMQEYRPFESDKGGKPFEPQADNTDGDDGTGPDGGHDDNNGDGDPVDPNNPDGGHTVPPAPDNIPPGPDDDPVDPNPGGSARERAKPLPLRDFENLWDDLASMDEDTLRNAGIAIVREHSVAVGGVRAKDISQNKLAQLRTIAYAFKSPDVAEPMIITVDYTEQIDGHSPKITLAGLGGEGRRVDAETLKLVRDYIENAVSHPDPELAAAIATFDSSSGENLREEGVWINEDDEADGQPESAPATSTSTRPAQTASNQSGRPTPNKQEERAQERGNPSERLIENEGDELRKARDRRNNDSTERGKSKESDRRTEALRLPPEFREMDRSAMFEWAMSLLSSNEAGKYPWAAIGAETGAIAENGKDRKYPADFIRYVDKRDGREHLLYVVNPNGKRAYYLATNVDGKSRSYLGSKAAVESFMRGLLGNINQAVREGATVDNVPVVPPPPGAVVPGEVSETPPVDLDDASAANMGKDDTRADRRTRRVPIRVDSGTSKTNARRRADESDDGSEDLIDELSDEPDVAVPVEAVTSPDANAQNQIRESLEAGRGVIAYGTDSDGKPGQYVIRPSARQPGKFEITSQAASSQGARTYDPSNPGIAFTRVDQLPN